MSTNKRGVSLGVKLSLGLVLIIGVLFAGVNGFNILTQRDRMRGEALLQNETVTRLVVAALTPELASSPIRSDRIRIFIKNFLAAALSSKRNRDLAFVVVTDAEGAPVGGRVKTDVTLFPGNKTMADEAQALNEIAKLKGNLASDMRVQSFSLVVSGTPMGKLYVGTSLARITEEARRDLIINIAVLAGALLVLVVYATFALRRMVTNPLGEVVSAMKDVQAGKLDHEVNLVRGDELGMLADTYNFMVRGLREREHLKDAFNRYVSKQVYEKMQAGAINLRGEIRNATVLFSDIRSFTSLSEQLTPQEVVAMLNEYFTEMVEMVFKYDGFLNKFIGDAIMAVYNVPLDQDHPELRAVKTALEMTRALERLNARREARGQFAIKIGIGINTGPVVAGNLGHEQRLEYTVIGDAVNLAQRLESQTKVAGTTILISEATYAPCAPYIEATALPPVKVKGKQENVALYAVTGLKDGTLRINQQAPNAQAVAAAQILEHG